MQCAELMKTDVRTLRPEDSAQTAARTMRDCSVGFLPVCSSEGIVLGTLTDRDIALRVVADAIPASMPVGNFMTQDVVACRPTDDVRDAERLMSQARVSRIICIDESSDRLLGIISLSDLTQLE